MAETYHDEMLAHLYPLQREVTKAINTVIEIERNGGKYLAVERSKLVSVITSYDSLVKSHGRGHWKREIIGAGKVEERTLRSR